MAYTTGKNSVQLATELVSAGVTSNGTAVQPHDANTVVATAGHLPTNTIIVLFGILVKVTTNWNNAGTAGAQFSYDANPS